MFLPASSRVESFTLIELLLSVALLMMLLGALVLSFSTFRRGAELDEGATRFETLVQLARAHAANTGRKVEIYCVEGETEFLGEALGSVSGRIGVAWEPEPLDAPGIMIDLEEPGWNLDQLNDMVAVASVRSLGASALPAGPLSEAGPADEWEENVLLDEFFGFGGALALGPSWSPIGFYPDGSCDSVEVTLVSRDAEDQRRVSVQLVGMTGQVRRTLLPGAPGEQGLGLEEAGEPVEGEVGDSELRF